MDARNIDGSTPLCDACAAGSLDCVKLLLEYGATVNPPLFTFSPLHEACMGGVCCYSTYNITQECVLSHVSVHQDVFASSVSVCVNAGEKSGRTSYLSEEKKENN